MDAELYKEGYQEFSEEAGVYEKLCEKLAEAGYTVEEAGKLEADYQSRDQKLKEMLRAARNSKTGFVKMVLNFCVSQGLLMEAQSRYYPTDRFKALIENYFDEYKGRMAEIMQSLI